MICYIVIMIDIDTNIDKWENQLRLINKKAIPYATREALNQVAFKARRLAQRTISQNMVLKNKWTQRSIQVNRATALSLLRQESEIGSTESYMELQEFGGQRTAKGKHGVPIPTAYAAGQGRSGRRTRTVRSQYRLARIKLQRKYRTLRGNAKQRLLVNVAVAVRAGEKFVYLEMPGSDRKGIYKIVGGTYRGHGWPKGAKIELVHDLTSRSVRIPATSWLRPSANIAALSLDDYYRRALTYQINRWVR